MTLKTKRPTSIEAFINGAKADAGQVPVEQPAKKPTKTDSDAPKVKTGRGKPPSEMMAPENSIMSRYQIRFPLETHQLGKMEAARQRIPFCDLVIKGMLMFGDLAQEFEHYAAAEGLSLLGWVQKACRSYIAANKKK